MPKLVVRGLEAELVQRLKERAVAHGVSAEEEHRRILRQALNEADDEFPDLKALLMGMPAGGEDADFARVREIPREVPTFRERLPARSERRLGVARRRPR
jgi:plasmid stability protein